MKSTKWLLLLGTTIAALALPSTTLAQQAYVTDLVNLRAGPASDYPIVAEVRQGSYLTVQGCLDGFSWCDVTLPGNLRGWIAADYIQYATQNSQVSVVQHSTSLSIPVITFVLGTYWGSYYRDRPWYAHQSQWQHHRPPVHVRPPYYQPRPPAFRPPTQHPSPPHARPPYQRPPVDFRPPSQRPPSQVRPPYQRPPVDFRPPSQRPPSQVRPPYQRPPANFQRPSHHPSAQKPQHSGNRPSGNNTGHGARLGAR